MDLYSTFRSKDTEALLLRYSFISNYM